MCLVLLVKTHRLGVRTGQPPCGRAGIHVLARTVEAYCRRGRYARFVLGIIQPSTTQSLLHHPFSLISLIACHNPAPIVLILLHHRSLCPLLLLHQLPLPLPQQRHLGLCHLKHVLAQVLHTLHVRDREPFLTLSITLGPRRREHLAEDEPEGVGAAQQQAEGVLELGAGLEDLAAAEDVEAEAGAGQRDGQAADVAEVADVTRADQGEDDVWCL